MRIVAIFLLSGFTFLVWGQTIEEQGRKLLFNSDRRLYPDEGTFDMLIGEIKQGVEKKMYTMQIYKKGKTKSTTVCVYPEVMKNNVSMKNGDIIYYKARKAFKPDIISYNSMFLDSGFSWGDVLATDLVDDYRAVKIEKVKEDGRDCRFLQLEPTKEDRYARIDVWIDETSFDSIKRIYYTASGDIFKKAGFSDLKVEGGKITGFRVEVEDFFMETINYAVFSNIKEKKLPEFLFDVKSINRIHVAD